MAACRPSMTKPTPSLPEVLGDGRWLRRLARNLASSHDEVDDLTQEACLQALRKPPGEGESMRGWFHRVLRNLRRQRHRSDVRRRNRELNVAQPALHGAPPDLIERAATHRLVLDSVLALNEPYRSTVLLRFFEELQPSEIAARLGVPVATVHTRLQRAFAQLRNRLDSRLGSRSAWAGLLLPLTTTAIPAPPLWILLMQAKAIAAVTVLAVGLSIWWLITDQVAPPSQTGQGDVVQAATADKTSQQYQRLAAANGRAPAPVVEPHSGSQPKPAEGLRQLRGRVVTSEGAVAANIGVAMTSTAGSRPQQPSTQSNGEGYFELPCRADRSGTLLVQHPQWRTVLASNISVGTAAPLYLVVAERSLSLCGTVRSSDGTHLTSASVRLLWPTDLRSRLSDISDTSSYATIVADCDEHGAFNMLAASVRGAELLITAPGHLPDRRALPGQPETALEIVLHSPQMQEGMLQGMVVNHRGHPVADAQVALGRSRVQSKGDGTFLLADDGKSANLMAARAGSRRAHIARPPRGFDAFTVLTLAGDPLTIRGRVADQTGRGLAGIKVWIRDPTVMCLGDNMITSEGVSTNCAPMSELRERHRRGEAIDPQSIPMSQWPWVKTDSSGAFVLKGLEQRDYTLRAMHTETMQSAELSAVAAGSTGVVIELATTAIFQDLEGTVVNHRGDGIPSARVRVQIDTQSIAGNTMHAVGALTAVCDDRGHFKLKNVPHHFAYLRVDGDRVLPVEYGRGEDGGLLALADLQATTVRIVARERMHVQVELVDPATADAFSILDGEGEVLTINVFEGRGRREIDSMQFADGRSAVFVVPDTAATLVLRKGDKEVLRHSLVLHSGSVNQLTL